MEKIKILHIVMYMGTGGLEHVTIDLCRKIDKEKYEVSVLCTEGCDPKYKVKLFKYRIPLYIIEKTKKIDFSFYQRVNSLINKLHIDIVHIHSCVFDSSLGSLFSHVKGKIFTAHGLPVATDYISRCQDHIGFRLVDKIVAVSDEVAENLWHRFKLPREKIDIVYNGIEIPEIDHSLKEQNYRVLRKDLNIALDSIIIGAIGRLVPVKNYTMLLQSFKQLLEIVDKKIQLVFVGDGSEREYLETLSKDLHIEKTVSFLGIRDDVGKLLDAMDVFVLTSVTEGVSISLLEAQAKGIPAVVTDVGGNGCVVTDGETGFLVELNDFIQFSEKIKILIENKNIYESFSDFSLKKITTHFNIDIVTKRYEKLYESLL